MNKRERLTNKLRDALDRDHELQGDLGIQEVEEILLFLMDETNVRNSVIPSDARISAGSKEESDQHDRARAAQVRNDADQDGVPVEQAPAVHEHVQPKPGNPDAHLGNPVDESDNADADLGQSGDKKEEELAKNDSEGARSKAFPLSVGKLEDKPRGKK